MLTISPIPAFQDNYFWCVHNQTHAIIIDPGMAEPVLDFLNQNSLKLTDILITHHHADHIGGIDKLISSFAHPINIYSPKDKNIPTYPNQFIIKFFIKSILKNQNKINIKSLNLEFNILLTPGHTLSHICYFADAKQNILKHPVLFCGDTLFSGGCGKMFEGSPEQFWESFQKIKALPNNTLIYPAHEYTLSNAQFLNSIEPNNLNILNFLHNTQKLRNLNCPTLPTDLKTEKKINLFLNSQSPEDFLKLRQQKDCF